jgi:hypothetical protein
MEQLLQAGFTHNWEHTKSPEQVIFALLLLPIGVHGKHSLILPIISIP